MSILDRFNRIISENKEYSKKLLDLQKGDPQIIVDVHNTLDEIKKLDGVSPRVRNFYYYGVWFVSFVNTILIPLYSLATLLSKQHIGDLVRKFQNSDLQVSEASIDFIYEFLTELNDAEVRKILAIATSDTYAVNSLSHAVRIKDEVLFFNIFQNLNVRSGFLKAINYSFLIIGICENALLIFDQTNYNKEQQEEQLDICDFAAIYKSIASEDQFNKATEILNNLKELSLMLTPIFSMLDDFDDFDDTANREKIEAEYNYKLWIKIAQGALLFITLINDEIRSFLTDEEIESLNKVLDKTDNIRFISNGRKSCPTEDVVDVVMRWYYSYVYKPIKSDYNNDQNIYEQPSTSYINHSNVLPVRPKLNYAQMRKIACRLAAQPWPERDDDFKPRKDYIKATDIVKFCRFFMQTVESPDDIKDVDLSTPIYWNGSWQGFKYFVFRLYGKPEQMPSGLSKVIVDGMRFRQQKKRKMSEEGKVAFDTYNTAKPLQCVSEEDKELINDILKGCMPM